MEPFLVKLGHVKAFYIWMCQSWKTTNGEPNQTSTENFQIKHRNYPHQNRAKQPVVVVDTGFLATADTA